MMQNYTYQPDIVAKTKIQGHCFVNAKFTVKFLYPAIYMNALVTMVPIILYKSGWSADKTLLLGIAVLVPALSAVLGTYGGPIKAFFRNFHAPIAYASLVPLGYSGSLSGLDLIIIGVSVLWGIIYWCIMGAGLGDPLKRTLAVLDKVQNGQLNERVVLNFDRNDEMGKVIKGVNLMLDYLSDVMGNINKSIATVATSAGQLSTQAMQTTAGATENASTIGEVAATIEDVSVRTRKVSQKAEHAMTVANEGNESITRVMKQMDAINRTNNDVSGVVVELAQQSNQINQIIDVITDIADQTNLLSLNAAIEAARAGDQGRGFAVVAEEVRKLAEQSRTAAGEIRHLIDSVQKTSQSAVAAMEVSTHGIKDGLNIVGEAENSFKRIETAMTELVDQIEGVSSASGEISGAIQNIAASSEEQTAAMEEVSAAVEVLSKTADELKILSEKFTFNN